MATLKEVARRAEVSLGTVYKNLNTFLESGLLKEVTLHHGSLRMEANMTPHHHAVCSSCRAIFDIEYTALRMLAEAEREFAGRGVALWLVAMNPGVSEVVARSVLVGGKPKETLPIVKPDGTPVGPAVAEMSARLPGSLT